MEKAIFQTIVFLLTSFAVLGQTNNKVYKKLSDSSFSKGDIILAPKVLFTLGTSEIMESFTDSIKLIADFIKKHPTFKIAIGAYTDTRSTVQGAMNLTQRRADTICKYLTRIYQIPKSNLKAIGYGYFNPIVSDATIHQIDRKTEEGRLQIEKLHATNRRIEIKILATK